MPGVVPGVDFPVVLGAADLLAGVPYCVLVVVVGLGEAGRRRGGILSFFEDGESNLAELARLAYALSAKRSLNLRSSRVSPISPLISTVLAQQLEGEYAFDSVICR